MGLSLSRAAPPADPWRRRAMLAAVGLELTHALADTKLPLLPYDRDHDGNLVIVARKHPPGTAEILG